MCKTVRQTIKTKKTVPDLKCIICHYGNIMKLLQIFHLFLLYLHSAVRWECVFVKVFVDTKWSFSKEVVYKVELTVSVRWMDMESTFSTRWTRKIAFYAQHSVQATNFQLQSCSEEVVMHRTKLATGRVNDIPALCKGLLTFTYYCRHRRITKKFTTTHYTWMGWRGKLSEYIHSNFSLGKESFTQPKVTKLSLLASVV